MFTAAIAVSGCARNLEGGLLHLRTTGTGPDEFAILPTKPLTMPENLTALPEPTLGGENLADPTPELDAVAVLGGNPKRVTRPGITRADQGIINVTGRYGVAPDIRQTLAAEDLEYRNNNRGRLLERLFKTSVYFKAYKPLSLDRYNELRRLRKAGVRTPAAPPNPDEG